MSQVLIGILSSWVAFVDGENGDGFVRKLVDREYVVGTEWCKTERTERAGREEESLDVTCDGCLEPARVSLQLAGPRHFPMGYFRRNHESTFATPQDLEVGLAHVQRVLLHAKACNRSTIYLHIVFSTKATVIVARQHGALSHVSNYRKHPVYSRIEAVHN